MKSRRFFCTWNNYTEDNYDEVLAEGKAAKYFICCREVGEECKTPHLHFGIHFKNQRSLNAVRKLFKCDVRIANGDDDSWMKYMSKQDPEPVIYGKPAKPGERKDLDEIKNEIMEGKRVDEICEESPMIFHLYGRTLDRLETIALKKRWRTEFTTGTWLYGPTGTGKSYRAFKDYHPDTHYIWKDDLGWQDDYKGQETVIINEFRGEIRYKDMLELTDENPFNVRRRGREMIPFISKKIIVTSSLHPMDIYNNLAAKDSLEQLLRRFEIIEMTQRYSEGNNTTSEPK